MATATYTVPECNLPALEAQVEKLSRRCTRLGMQPITLTKTMAYVKARCNVLTVDGHINGRCWEFPEKIAERNAKWPCDDTGERMAWYNVTVTGETPCLAGWTFVAVLEPMTTEDGETLNFVRALPGQTCPAEYRDAIGRCDHCNAARRRRETFVVRNETTGETKCVGRQCLKDFLGYHADPHTLASLAELLAQLQTMCGAAEDFDEEGFGGGGYRSEAWDLTKFLALTACRIRLFGWLGRGKAREDYRRDATADVVLDLLTPPNPKYASAKQIAEYEAYAAQHVATDADVATAEAAIEWVKDLPVAELEGNDYLSNCNLVARVGIASKKTAGIAASILVAHARAMEKEIARQAQAAKPESNHIGEVGKRIALLEVTCEKVLRSEGQYGVTGIHKMHDAAGNDLTWFASAGTEWIAEGATVHIAAGVKTHGEFRGRKQTVLTRVTVWTPEGVAEYQAKEAKKAARAAKKTAKA